MARRLPVAAVGVLVLCTFATLLSLNKWKDWGSCRPPTVSPTQRDLAAWEQRLRLWEAELKVREATITAAPPECATTTEAAMQVDQKGVSPRALVVPCPSTSDTSPCSGNGRCDFHSGVCQCSVGFAGMGCSVKVKGNGTKWTDDDNALETLRMDPSQMAQLLTVVVMHSGKDEERLQRIKSGLKKVADGIAMLTADESVIHDVNRAVHSVATPFTLLIASGTELSSESNIDTLLSLMLSTDVDVLGFLQTVPAPLTKREIGGITDDVVLKGTRHLLPMCHEMRHSQWQLSHYQAAFGYSRHERFVAYCDRTSNSFVFRTSLLKGGQGTFHHFKSDRIGSAASFDRDDLFWAPAGSMIFADLFLSIKSHNARLRRDAVNATSARFPKALAEGLATLAAKAPTRLPGYVLVGTCAECMINVERSHDEVLNSDFAERHQIEFYVDTRGRPSTPVCVKSGGIYGHSLKGFYSPACHRFHRQRDFLVLAKLWLDPSFAALPKISGQRDHVYGVSLHHGNLFGALRMQEELLWETDGDIDFIAFNATHEEMMRRWQELIQVAESKHGFQTQVTYPEKPWYVGFKRDKTDFQCNARSPLDPATRGKPPQQHRLTVDYQGRRVFMNGFANPWRGIRSDPGHDYRTKYLAQQGWVPQFTKKSIACSVPGHNACLPDCNDPFHQLDHNWCSDPATASVRRDPVLHFDTSVDRMTTKVMLPDQQIFAGESGRWRERHAWRYW